MEKAQFLNKHCKLVFNDGFTLYGIVKDINDFGVVFETKQKASFITFENIKLLEVDCY